MNFCIKWCNYFFYEYEIIYEHNHFFYKHKVIKFKYKMNSVSSIKKLKKIRVRSCLKGIRYHFYTEILKAYKIKFGCDLGKQGNNDFKIKQGL